METNEEIIVIHRDDSEPLLPELEMFVVDGWVSSPFVWYPLNFGTKNINDVHRHTQRMVDAAWDAEDWYWYIFHHRKPYRLVTFCDEVQHELSDEQYWKLLSSIYTDAENLWQCGPILSELLSSDRSQRHFFMDQAEHAVLNGLPEQITVYRGHKEHNFLGWSWTLDRDKAVWFATRFQDGTPHLSSGVVSKGGVIAYLDCRKEQEIVVDPMLVRDVATAEL